MIVSGTITLLILVVLAFFAVKAGWHHIVTLFLGVMLGVVLLKSALAGPANTIVTQILNLPMGLLHALHINV